MIEFAGPFGLFLASFLAATIFPFQSEAFLVALVIAGDHPWWLLLGIASTGNIAGAVVNWGLGRFLYEFRDRRWFPVKARALERAGRHYRRWGVWSLLFAWVPFVGDPLTVAAGIFRTNLGLFFVFVSIGKTARYAFLVAAALAWI